MNNTWETIHPWILGQNQRNTKWGQCDTSGDWPERMKDSRINRRRVAVNLSSSMSGAEIISPRFACAETVNRGRVRLPGGAYKPSSKLSIFRLCHPLRASPQHVYGHRASPWGFPDIFPGFYLLSFDKSAPPPMRRCHVELLSGHILRQFQMRYIGFCGKFAMYGLHSFGLASLSGILRFVNYATMSSRIDLLRLLRSQIIHENNLFLTFHAYIIQILLVSSIQRKIIY